MAERSGLHIRDRRVVQQREVWHGGGAVQESAGFDRKPAQGLARAGVQHEGGVSHVQQRHSLLQPQC